MRVLHSLFRCRSGFSKITVKVEYYTKRSWEKITQAAKVDMIDWEKLEKRTSIVGYPILPLVEQLSEKVEGNFGQFCHWGATTQDIMDTADVLQIRKGLELLSKDLKSISDALEKIVEHHIKHLWLVEHICNMLYLYHLVTRHLLGYLE